MVFYRKYRPQSIEDLDSKEVRDKLTSVLTDGDIHALLFTGPKGLGKTSTARIIAKVLNCEKLQIGTEGSSSVKAEKKTKPSIIEPCNKCDQCISITKGSNIDILEIDGASNRGIDEIRDLREKVKLSPARSKKKVYIIDEVHMLTTEAFNALLKTLEEPPDHVVFILCTTEPHKVPATISSRCFHISFKKATDAELVRAFSRIIKAEKIQADNDALLEIANFSDGSFRDGVKILEELALISGDKKITKEFVEKTYQTSGVNKNIEDMMLSLIAKDVKSGVSLVKDLIHAGTDLNFYMQRLISYLHEILLEKTGVTERSSKIGEEIELNDLINLINLLSNAVGKMKYSILPQLPLEIAIVEWSMNDVSNGAEVVSENFRVHNAGKVSSSKNKSEGASVHDENFENSPRLASSTSSSSDDILQKLIDKIKTTDHSIAGFLRGCTVKNFEDGKIILEAKYEFHKDKLQNPKSTGVIEDVLEEITGNKVYVSFVLKS